MRAAATQRSHGRVTAVRIAVADSCPMTASDQEAPATLTCGNRVREQWKSHDRAGRLATAIKAAGIQPGERVALMLRNDIEFLEVSLAAASCGANPVPINWHWTSPEVQHVLSDSGVRLVFAHTEFVGTVQQAIETAGLDTVLVEVAMPPELLSELGLSPELSRVTGTSQTLEEWIEDGAEPLPYQEGAIADSMGLIYTSGTTGTPKGVMRERMTPHQLLSIAGGTANRMGLAPGGQMLVAGPLYHTSPNALAVLALRMGTNITIMPRFDAERFLQHVAERKIQQVKIVPTMLSRLLSLPDDVRARYDVSSLTHVIHSAAPCPPAVKEAAIQWFGNALIEFYGCSEAGTITWINADEWLARPGSVGRPVDGADVLVADDEGNKLPAGETGRVYVKGADYWPAFEYLNHASTNKVPFPGYITVGDEGYLDDEGFLYLTGRTAEVIISGGVNIYPAEIENAITALGTVEDVAVFGVPGGEFGESVAAHVIPRPGANLTPDGIRESLDGVLARYKIPSTVVITDSLPREDSGKIFKSRLKTQYV